MLTLTQTGITPQQLQQNLLLAAAQASGADGVPAEVTEALIQLHRFTIANIEVDTARTKNSLFISSGAKPSGGWWGAVASNVSYSPYVRDKINHNMHFFEYTGRKEGPNVMSTLGRNITIKLARTIVG